MALALAWSINASFMENIGNLIVKSGLVLRDYGKLENEIFFLLHSVLRLTLSMSKIDRYG